MEYECERAAFFFARRRGADSYRRRKVPCEFCRHGVDCLAGGNCVPLGVEGGSVMLDKMFGEGPGS